ncbi:MAG TPA: autotransporter outer membrane beta-barrel domain-containing protein [Bacteroidota bacterium]
MKTRPFLLLPIIAVFSSNPFSVVLGADSIFGLRASVGASKLQSPRLATALERYPDGDFDQSSWSANGGLAADVAIHPNVHLSLEVQYLSSEFSFYPDRTERRGKATWDVSLVPVMLRVLYALPYSIGPALPFVSLGGGYIFSAVNVTANYGLIFTNRLTATFHEVNNGDGGWMADLRGGVLFRISQSLWLEGYAGYAVSSSLSTVEALEKEPGVISMKIRSINVDIRSYTAGFSVSWLPF